MSVIGHDFVIASRTITLKFHKDPTFLRYPLNEKGLHIVSLTLIINSQLQRFRAKLKFMKIYLNLERKKPTTPNPLK